MTKRKNLRQAEPSTGADETVGLPAEPSQGESTRETIDSIVIAFILAFVFRAFIIEAFVIPTGSMAATLYGKHGTVVCEDCGWEFSYGLQDEYRNDQTQITPSSRARCPNCAHENTNLAINDVERNAQAGDRILVLKWPLDVGIAALGPERWDVTVFKNPTNGKDNYIKRLIGLPEEVLEIIDGDIYTVPIEELSQEAIQTLDMRVRAAYLDWVKGAKPGIPLPEGTPSKIEALHELNALAEQLDDRIPRLMAELDQNYQIQRKSESAQSSLWSVVYHHDYLPVRLDAGQPRWATAIGGTGLWDTAQRNIRFSADGQRAESIQLGGKPIVDEYGYNVGPRQREAYPVSDLRVSFVLVPGEGDGHLDATLSKSGDAFTARISTNGTVALLKGADDAQAMEMLSESSVDPLVTGKPIAVEFRNVDYRATLFVDGEKVLSTSDEQFPFDTSRLRHSPGHYSAPPQIRAAGMDLELWHLSVDRDVYYEPVFLGPSDRRWGWGTAGNPIYLREGEHFMLGDNSPASQDSRWWTDVGPHLWGRGADYQRGTVPEDQLIGRAFFVYWPSGLATDLVPGLDRIRIIPNVGDMRWIR